MPLGEKKVRRLTGLLLVAGVLVTRLPFISRMLFEFDSIDFAVATFRFDLAQVTPHFPGYILHILFAKFLLLFTSDVNLAFVWISILLSIGSVLFLWRAGAALRGERVGVICAALWLFTPIFWFHGEVATAYVYEAFFAAAFLYFGISLLKDPQKKIFGYLLFLLLSLATGARQSSILFFTPSIIYALWVTRQSLKTWLIGAGVFCIVTSLWLAILFNYSGGISQYFAQAGNETVYKSQSILFGNSLQEHIAVIGKVFIYLIFASLPCLILSASVFIRYVKKAISFTKELWRKPVSVFIMLVAFPALLFYLGIYFMKAGYLLNILPSITLVTAVLLDQMAIWRAEKIKLLPKNTLMLTRPIITSGVTRSVILMTLVNLIIFFTPFPWTCSDYFYKAFTKDSFNAGLTSLSRGLYLNRLASFSNLQGIDHIDELNTVVLSALKNEKPEDCILLDTWWHRWGYYYLPQSTIYDIRDFPGKDSLWIGRSEHYHRDAVGDRAIRIPNDKKVLVLLREDHPSFSEIARQVHLERLSLPQYLDIYQITDEHFSFRWKDVWFTK
jgi:hypothetical protein